MTTEEKRQYDRSSINIPVGITAKDRFYQGWIKNIALGGLFIKVSGSFSVGQDISFYFFEETKKAKIIWIGNQGIGVKFKRPVNCEKIIA
jgi:Tfp pilus assembly protein PilZ